jgi:hypothetical protein
MFSVMAREDGSAPFLGDDFQTLNGFHGQIGIPNNPGENSFIDISP